MERLVALPEIRNFMIRCMQSVGTEQKHAVELAEVLVAADYRGHYSHGLNRLAMYVKDIKTRICEPSGSPQILKETVSTALVDGKNLLGPVIGNYCMKLAIKKAKDTGIGWVVAKGCNHFGICGWYSMQASKEGLVGMAFTNASPLVVPTRGKSVALGTNPISVAAPAKGDDFVLDMAMSTVALGKVEMQDRKNQLIPEGWGVNKDGKVTTNPKEVLNGGALLPLGGDEITGGYKGYGLSMMSEIFCGILSGAAYGSHIRQWLTTTEPANLGQCFVAINPDAFALGFEDRMSDLMNLCRQQEPITIGCHRDFDLFDRQKDFKESQKAEGKEQVLVAGDPEKQHMAKCDVQGGICYHVNQITFANELANQLGVDPVKVKS